MINNISFKGTYKISYGDDRYDEQKFDKYIKAQDYLSERAINEHTNIPQEAPFSESDPHCLLGSNHHANVAAREKFYSGLWSHYVVDDSLDSTVESYLSSNGINFKRFTDKELFSEEAIKARMVVPEHWAQRGWQLADVKTKEFNDLYKQEVNSGYVGDKENIEHPARCKSFKEYLKTGLSIDAPSVNLTERDGRLNITFNDGRHRYAVMRDDLGFEKIPVALDDESLEIAKKYGVID